MTLYEDVNYGGASRTFGLGMQDLPGWTGTSSLRIPAALQVRCWGNQVLMPAISDVVAAAQSRRNPGSPVPSGPRYHPWPITFSGDTPNVGWANDAITRIEVSIAPAFTARLVAARNALQPAGQADDPTWQAMVALLNHAEGVVTAVPPAPTVEQLMSDLQDQETQAGTLRNELADAKAAIAELPSLIGALQAAMGDSPAPAGLRPDVADVIAKAYDANTARTANAAELTRLTAQRANAKLEVWADPGLSGQRMEHGLGDWTLKEGLPNDWVSSLRCSDNVMATAYEHDDGGGWQITFTGQSATLRFVGFTPDDNISRFRVAMTSTWEQQFAKVTAATAQLEADFNAASAALTDKRSALQAELDRANADLTSKTPELAAVSAGIEHLRGLLAGDNGVTMPLVAVDGRGLTVTGAVCEFAGVTYAPCLFESALGRVSMYFRGLAGEFLVAHYTTFTGRTTFVVAAERGSVGLAARFPELDALTVDVQPDPADAERCTLTVALADPRHPVTETWRAVPRDAARLADVLNGAAAAPRVVGIAVPGVHEHALALRDPLKLAIEAGALVQVGDVTRAVSAPAAAAATTIALDDGPAITVGDSDSDPRARAVHAIAYDYAANASSTQVPSDLSQGSGLVAVLADGASGPVAFGTPVASAGSSSRWAPSAPGRSLELDGHEGCARAAAGSESAFATPVDVTVEAWINPTAASGRARVLQQWAGDAGYGLALVPDPRSPGNFVVQASVDRQWVEAQSPIAADRWTHLAGAYHRGLAPHFSGDDANVDCGADSVFDLADDLTLEVALRLDGPGGTLLARSAGADEASPYTLAVDGQGRVVFGYGYADGTQAEATTSDTVLAPGTFYRVAVTRKRVVVPSGTPGATPQTSHEIRIFVRSAAGPLDNAKPKLNAPKDVGASTQPVRIGQGLRGEVAEARVWRIAREPEQIWSDPPPQGVGLVARWRFAEREGRVAADAAGTNHGTFRGAITRVTSPDPSASSLALHIDGVRVATQAPPAERVPVAADPQFTLGALGNAEASEFLQGQLEDVRIWRETRTTEEIQDNMFRRLTGDQRDPDRLLHVRPGAHRLDHGRARGDRDGRQSAADLTRAQRRRHGAAPVDGADLRRAPEVRNVLLQVRTDCRRHRRRAGGRRVRRSAERRDRAGDRRVQAVLRSAATARWQARHRVQGRRHDVEWIGQVQFDPQIIGYIEGAPPVPSENLTVAEDSTRRQQRRPDGGDRTTTYTYASDGTPGSTGARGHRGKIGASTEVAWAGVGTKAYRR